MSKMMRYLSARSRITVGQHEQRSSPIGVTWGARRENTLCDIRGSWLILRGVPVETILDMLGQVEQYCLCDAI